MNPEQQPQQPAPPTQQTPPQPQYPQPQYPQMDQLQQAPQAQVKNPLAAMAPGEQVIFEVKRHPFGLITTYLILAVLLILAAAGVAYAPTMFPDVDEMLIKKISMAVFALTAALVSIIALVAYVVYYGNRWILTSDSLTQISQNSLFDKRNSQLSLGNLEDISAYQEGILPHIFGFGMLKVETAGEHEKFSLQYCPKPNKYAQQILMAREAFERHEQNGSHG